MAANPQTKSSERKFKKAPPSKKGRASKYRPGGRLSRIKSTHPSATTERAKTRAIAIASNMAFESWVIFGGSDDKPEGQMTPMEKMAMVDRGVTKKDLESLKDKTELDYDELAKVLSVGRATLINKKGDDKFSPPLSEKIVGLADLYSYGYEVFEDKERFNQWMLRPNQALGGQAPYDLIHNQFGREEVRNVIGRIEYGVYS
jgi:putative toxin-antitoxin system antitoxin component (TIGR02293 family)